MLAAKSRIGAAGSVCMHARHAPEHPWARCVPWLAVAQVDFRPRYAAFLRDVITKGVASQANPEKPLVRWGCACSSVRARSNDV